MMDRKTWLVARREYVENIRTKTFWIGILMLPVIIGVSIGAQFILKGAKEIRTYAVLDLSEDGFLDEQIQQRAATVDLGEFSAKAAAESEDAADAAADRTERLRAWYESLAPDHPLKDLARRLDEAGVEFDPAQMEGGSPLSALDGKAAAVLRDWWGEILRDKAKREQFSSIASDLSLGRYKRVPLKDLGIDPASGDVEQQLNEKIQDESLFAYFVLPPDPVKSEEGARYVSNNLTDNDLRKWFERRATEVVRAERVRELGLSKEDAASIQDEFQFLEQKISDTGEAEEVENEEKAAQFAPVAFVYLLWIAVFTAAQMLLTNTVEEKSNRLIEVLLSSVSPMQLMAGKVIGIAATGLTIVVSWVVTSVVGLQLVPSSSPLGQMNLASIVGDPLYLSSFVAYFLAGYLLFGAILVALGSVCNSLKEAQNLMQPVFILLIVPLIAMVFVVQEPNGTVARVLTYIPFFTPFLMMNRAGGPPPTWEYIATTILIVVSLWLAFRFAARVFRVGILMTGKPPKLGEVLRWMRAPLQ